MGNASKQDVTRRRTLGLLAGGVGAVLAPWSGPALAQDTTFFRIGTGSTGGTYYPVGSVIANVISKPPGSRSNASKGGSCGVPGLVAVAQATDGVDLRMSRRSTRAHSNQGSPSPTSLFWAYNGNAIFADQEPLAVTLRLIANLYPEVVQIVVRKGCRDHHG